MYEWWWPACYEVGFSHGCVCIIVEPDNTRMMCVMSVSVMWWLYHVRTQILSLMGIGCNRSIPMYVPIAAHTFAGMCGPTSLANSRGHDQGHNIIHNHSSWTVFDTNETAGLSAVGDANNFQPAMCRLLSCWNAEYCKMSLLKALA